MAKYHSIRIRKADNGRQWVVKGQRGQCWEELLRYALEREATAVAMAHKLAKGHSEQVRLPVGVTMEGQLQHTRTASFTGRVSGW